MKAAPSVKRRLFRRTQRGSASVAIAILVMLLLAGAMATAFNVTSALVQDSVMNLQQTQALFVAESGLAQAVQQWGTYPGSSSPYCATYATKGPFNFGPGKFTISYFNTAVSGTVLTDQKTQCRVRVTGTVPATGGVSRTVEAMVQRSGNGFPPDANTDFNLPPGTCVYPGCKPSNWSFDSGAWDDFGDAQGKRAIFVGKTSSGQGTDVAVGGYNFYPPITRTAPLNPLTINFDYKNVINGGASKMHVNYVKLYETAPGTRIWTSTQFDGADTNGAWKTGSVTINLNGSGKVSLDRVEFKLSVESGNQYKSWLDNIQIGGAGTSLTTDEKALIMSWREVVQ